MPNWVYISFSLSGPDAELARFRRISIRPIEGQDKVGIDFGALVPEPDVFRAALAEGLEPAEEVAKAHTGYERVIDWRLQHWGTKWNAIDFAELHAEPGLYTAEMYTAWSTPHPVFAALAEQFPTLTGLVVAMEPGMEWCSAGFLSNGSFDQITMDLTPELESLMEQTSPSPILREAMMRALARHFALGSGVCPPALCIPQGVSSDKFLGEVLAELSHNHARHLSFLFDVERYVGWDDEDSRYYCEDNETSSREDVVRSPANLAFLQANGRCYHPIDRQLMSLVAQHLAESWNGPKPQGAIEDEFRIWVMGLLKRQDEEELYDWASYAALRKVVLDLTDLDTLRASFLAYAIGLSQQTSGHLTHYLAEAA